MIIARNENSNFVFVEEEKAASQGGAASCNEMDGGLNTLGCRLLCLYVIKNFGKIIAPLE